MSVYKVKLTKKVILYDDTMAFYFQKPDKFNFQAGQYADYILINPNQTDKEGNVRSFTLACAPHENDICIVTRMRDTAFKRVLKDMEIGDEIKLDGPNGNFTLKQTSSVAVYLTGGIGITPARSIISQATHENLNQKIILLYSVKTINSAAFIDELYDFAKLNNNFEFIPTVTSSPDKDYSGEVGRINVDMLKRHIPDLSKPDYYICGPPAMVNSLRSLLICNGVKKRCIFVEEFEGY